MKLKEVLKDYFEDIKKELLFYNSNSYSPYSKFRVSSVLMIMKNNLGEKEITFIGGTNIENSSYGLTICAERVAVFKAVSNGLIPSTNLNWLVLFLYSPINSFITPCGACRQVISEFVKDIPIVVFNKNFEYKIYNLDQIFKEVFGSYFFENS